jgi:hypothetical protein
MVALCMHREIYGVSYRLGLVVVGQLRQFDLGHHLITVSLYCFLVQDHAVLQGSCLAVYRRCISNNFAHSCSSSLPFRKILAIF